MWQLKYYFDFEKRLKKFQKRHRQETLNALVNLDSYLKALQDGLSPQQIVRGWIHPEPQGVKAIDQSGPQNPRKALRLYVYPDVAAEVLHVLTLGDKDSQSDDLAACRQFVDELTKQQQADLQSPSISKGPPDDQADQPGE